jgi:hypothetical protein
MGQQTNNPFRLGGKCGKLKGSEAVRYVRETPTELAQLKSGKQNSKAPIFKIGNK